MAARFIDVSESEIDDIRAIYTRKNKTRLTQDAS